ncbi:MAG: FAD-dependent oxidoreductase, partial [Candidatus Omnitrophica bacterium]|nr:FAD-dependent oxidoreductase [Candidatus Omnitrophota bacterium]
MANRIKEKARLIEVKNYFDVVVVGGGIAGAAAAIAAARNKARVCLIERYCVIGGLATAGNINVYLPLCDGNGHQVITGLAEEFMKISISDGYGKIPDCWLDEKNIEQRRKKRLEAEFNPWNLALELEKMLVMEGVEIMYDTRFCSVIKKKNRITHIVVENKKGRFAIECCAAVDATGDADVCVAVGETVEIVNNNVACGWFFYFDGKSVQRRA